MIDGIPVCDTPLVHPSPHQCASCGPLNSFPQESLWLQGSEADVAAGTTLKLFQFNTRGNYYRTGTFSAVGDEMTTDGDTTGVAEFSVR